MARPRSFDDDVVLDRAMESFWTNGYAATSPAQLAAATGIAKGSLYNAFSSKRELFEQCLDRYHQQIRHHATVLLARPGTARDCLRDALRSIVDADTAEPHRRGCLIGKTAVELAGQDADLAATIGRMQAESTGWFTARIERGQVEGDVAGDLDAQAFAEHLATTLAGLRVMAVTHEAPLLHRVIDTALRGL